MGFIVLGLLANGLSHMLFEFYQVLQRIVGFKGKAVKTSFGAEECLRFAVLEAGYGRGTHTGLSCLGSFETWSLLLCQAPKPSH